MGVPYLASGGSRHCLPVHATACATGGAAARAQTTRSACAVLGLVQIPTDYVLKKEGDVAAEDVLRGRQHHRRDVPSGRGQHHRRRGDVPAARGCSVLGAACTSLSYTLGPAHTDAQLRATNPDAATTDMARAAHGHK